MKNWKIPAAVIQQFAANEYVSACTATIDCNVPIQDPASFYCYVQEYGKTVQVEGVGPRTYGYYTPCGETHDVGIHGELVEYTFTKGIGYGANGKPVANPWVDLPEAVNCFVWFEHNDNGEVVDVHCTMSRDGFQANMS